MRRAFLLWINLVAVFFFFFPKMALSEEAHLFLCGIDMRIGMPKQDILNKLRQNYKLEKYPEKDNWRIVQKGGKSLGAAANNVNPVSDTDLRLAAQKQEEYLKSQMGTFSGKITVFDTKKEVSN